MSDLNVKDLKRALIDAGLEVFRVRDDEVHLAERAERSAHGSRDPRARRRPANGDRDGTGPAQSIRPRSPKTRSTSQSGNNWPT